VDGGDGMANLNEYVLFGGHPHAAYITSRRNFCVSWLIEIFIIAITEGMPFT
jgi:hypothetical protein